MSHYVLGIHDGHNCGATLVADGVIAASVSEERLTRRKNEVGYPARSIEEVLSIAGIGADRLDSVVYASNFMHARDYLENLDTWYEAGLAEQRADAAKPENYGKVIAEQRRAERIAAVCDHMEIDAARVGFVEHHLAHLAAAYYTSPYRTQNRPVLGLTCDGAGDGLCATVSVCTNNDIKRIASTDRHASLGKIYSRTTYLLGMKPWEHEYKLMGLAPYANPDHADKAAEPLRALLKVDATGLGFKLVGELSTNYAYRYLRDAFERVRFDAIAGGVQLFTEEMLLDWVRACIRHTGIGDLVCGGGVFMNVKANMLIGQLPEVKSLYVMPSAADESLSIGAALHVHYQRTGSTDHGPSVLENLYLGGSYSLRDEETAFRSPKAPALRVEQPKDMDSAIAELIANGEIVALCRGRMEWGARALGNRSIIASADDHRTVDLINRMIKQRDFWMPFAPSIKAESASRYFDDPDDLKPYFMTFAFPALDGGYDHLVAGSHPRDRTIRPQIVRATANPSFYGVIDQFEKRTGRSVVLNTSFNLHGEPIVNTPQDAVDVMQRSGLRYLAFDHFIVSKEAA